ncbi:MAG: T9SS type A sorting domain-containing protein [Sphingobacteriales bacterium]|nr:T9SS type A sorting domain-containing protein [Sphingobacteriales bacterium]MBK6888716.1 T9SS type A sorting domain-containing protein [Sphingobacteriales bacterium]
MLTSSVLAFAQGPGKKVTFQLDLSNEQAADVVSVAGNFQKAAGFENDWAPGITVLKDDNCDFIYEITVELPPGAYEYKYINGDAWGEDEAVPTDCATGGNRTFQVASLADVTLGPDCFAGCGVCMSTMPVTVPVTLRCDLSLQTPAAKVSVAGGFQKAAGFPNDWEPGAVLMTDDDGDKIYEVNLELPPMSCFEYKFINGDAWGADEGVPGECASNGNRLMRISNKGLDMSPVCFGTCAACPTNIDTINVTFQVDMTNAKDVSLVSVAGSFQAAAGYPGNWQPGQTIMTDDDGDKIYTITVKLPEGTYAYKFINGDAWGKDEAVPSACSVSNNREVVVKGPNDMVIPVVCFATCEPVCPEILPAVDVTFSVDILNSDEIYNTSGLFVAGAFTDPAWQKNIIQMTDGDGDGVYSATVKVVPGEYQYKYYNGTNGDPGSDEFAEIYKDTPKDCLVENGLGGYNRLLNIVGAKDPVSVPTYIYDKCALSTVGINNAPAFMQFSLLPNPSFDLTVLSFNNYNAANYIVSVSNLLGQTVQIHQTTGKQVSIDTAHLPNGLYLVTLTNTQGQQVSSKLIVN